jgi:hypothetical protein
MFSVRRVVSAVDRTWENIYPTFSSSLGSTLLLIKGATHDPLYLWDIRRLGGGARGCVLCISSSKGPPLYSGEGCTLPLHQGSEEAVSKGRSKGGATARVGPATPHQKP